MKLGKRGRVDGEERAPEHDEGAPAARGTRGLAAASGDEIVSLNCVSSM